MIIECENREEWLAERAKLNVNASDAAAILGYDADTGDGTPRRTALDVYVQKKSPVDTDTDQMLIGRCLEDGIGKVYAEKTRRPVLDPGDYTIWVHDEYPWIGATLDRLTSRVINHADFGESAPLELKHVGWYKRYEWIEAPPLWLQIQLQVQIACAGASWGAYCGIAGGSDIHLGDQERNEAFFESALPVFDEFRWRLENNLPPSVEMPRNLDAVKRLYPEDSGETVELGDDVATWFDQLQEVKAFTKEASELKDELEAKIKLAIGNATFGELPDGRRLSLKTTYRKAYTKDVKSGTYRTLRMIKE
jgi:predicted phage-related endonuclease